MLNTLRAYRQHVHVPLVISICLFGITANLLTLIVLTRRKMRCVPANVMLVGLAGAHLMLTLNYLLYTTYAAFVDAQCAVSAKSYVWLTALLVNVNVSLVVHMIQLAITWLLAVFRFAVSKWPQRFRFDLYKAKFGVAVIYGSMPIVSIPFYFNSIIVPYDYPANCTVSSGDRDLAYRLAYSDDTPLILYNFWFFAVVCKLAPSVSMAVLGPLLIARLVGQQRKRRRDFPSMFRKGAPTKRRRKFGVARLAADRPAAAKTATKALSTVHHIELNGEQSASTSFGASQQPTEHNHINNNVALMGRNADRLPATLTIGYAVMVSTTRAGGSMTFPPLPCPALLPRTFAAPTKRPFMVNQKTPQTRMTSVGSAPAFGNAPPLLMSSLSAPNEATSSDLKKGTSQELNPADSVRQQLVLASSISRRWHNSWRVPMLLAVIVCLCVAVELPQGLLNFAHGMQMAQLWAFPDHELYFHLGGLFEMLTMLYSTVNFLLYCTISSQFRQTFRQCFRCSFASGADADGSLVVSTATAAEHRSRKLALVPRSSNELCHRQPSWRRRPERRPRLDDVLEQPQSMNELAPC